VGTGIRRTQISAAATGEDGSTTSQPKPASILPTLNATEPAGAAIALLLVALVLSIYKPRGLTAYGQRKQHQQRMATATRRAEQAISRH
jgi:hypothetical protein